MTPTKDEVARIAAGLTKAQRWAIARGHGGVIASSTTPACRCALQRAGLVVERMYSETLTPLGEQVSAFIRTGESDA